MNKIEARDRLAISPLMLREEKKREMLIGLPKAFLCRSKR
jgi:hypothetical protein